MEPRYRRAKEPVARSHWQIIGRIAARRTPTTEIARVTGYSIAWIREIARRYRVDGPRGLGDRRHGTPGAAPLLPPPQQERLRTALGGPAPDGGLGTGRKVASWMSAALDRPVAEQRGWEWLRRLGFTPHRPRPRAGGADEAAPAAFTKGGSPTRWPPSPPPTPPRR